jgi:hypothetical protein
VTGLINTRMRNLAESFADLKVRLRMALAGEMAQLVAQAVGDVVRTLIAGRPGSDAVEPRRPSEWRDRDAWDDDDETDHEDRHPLVAAVGEEVPDSAPASGTLAAPLAVAAAVQVARWCLHHHSHLLTAIGAGLGVGLLGLSGSVLVRTTLSVFIAASDLLAVADGAHAIATHRGADR